METEISQWQLHACQITAAYCVQGVLFTHPIISGPRKVKFNLNNRESPWMSQQEFESNYIGLVGAPNYPYPTGEFARFLMPIPHVSYQHLPNADRERIVLRWLHGLILMDIDIEPHQIKIEQYWNSQFWFSDCREWNRAWVDWTRHEEIEHRLAYKSRLEHHLSASRVKADESGEHS